MGHENGEVVAIGLLASGPEVLSDTLILLHAEEGNVEEDAKCVAE